MDIQLLSKMVKELILDNDRVSLPGMGSFVADMVPASFSDRGYTINPPYRRLSFRSGTSQETDNLLVDLYASANKVSEEIATRAIADFVAEMKEELKLRKTVVFPELGRLRATRENVFFFVADENLDIFPEGFGLETISLKSHSKPTSFDFTELDAAVASVPETVVPVEPVAPVAAAIAEPEIMPEPIATADLETVVEAEPVVEPEPAVEPEPEPVIETEPEPAPAEEAPAAPEEKRWWLGEEEEDEEDEEDSIWKKGWFIALFAVIMLVVLAALAFAAFILLAKYCPDIVDKILYTQEELDIINRKL